MKSIRGSFIAAITLIPLGFACERSEPTPTEEPGRQTRPVTGEPEEREGVRGTIGEEEEREGVRGTIGEEEEREGARGTMGKEEEREPAAEVGKEPVSGTEPSTAAGKKTIDQITHARCEREQRCNNVGTDKKFVSMQSCMNKIRLQWQDELNARECPGGVVQKELSECLTEIKNEDCGNPFDTLSRVAACREGDICKETESKQVESP